jgi:soluble lytic murein transglycosylase-like protein
MSSNYDPLYDEAGYKYNIDPLRLKAHAIQESGEDPTRTGTSGEWGMMQFMPRTAADVGLNRADAYRPAPAIDAAARYLAMLDAKHTDAGGNTDLMASTAAYNGSGPAAAHYATLVGDIHGKLTEQGGLKLAAADKNEADDPFSQTLKAPAESAPPAAATSEAAPAPTKGPDTEDDPFAATLKGGPADATASSQTVMGKIGAGLSRAAHDLTDVPAELISRGAGAIGLTNALQHAGMSAPTPEQTAAADTAGRQQYENQYGDSTIAGAARIGGQIAGTVPLLMGGGGLIRGAGAMAERAAAGVAPNLLARGAGLAAEGAIAGGAAGAMTAGQSDEPITTQMIRGATAGAVAGPALGALGAAVNPLIGRSGGAAPEVAKLAQLARDKYGIPITAPQMSTNPLMRTVSDQSARLPFSGAGASAATQQTAWQRAVSRTFGEDTPLVTPEVMKRAATRIGGQFDGVAARTTIQADQALLGDLGRIQADAIQTLPGSEVGPINAQLNNIMEAASKGSGSISGDTYQALTRQNAPLGRAAQSGDPNVRFYARQVRDALDDAFQRSAAPEDQAALRQARSQYRAMKTVEDLVEKSPDGNLSPALLMGQVRGASSKFDSSTGGMAYTGGGELGDLARIGQLFLKKAPDSGTADRLLMYGLVTGAIPAAITNPLATAGAAGGLVANRLANAYLRSGGVANRLIQNSLNPVARSTALIPLGAPPAAIGYNALAGPGAVRRDDAAKLR